LLFWHIQKLKLTKARKLHAELAGCQTADPFHCQRKVAFKFVRIEPPGLPCLEKR